MTGRVRLAAIGIVAALMMSSAGWAADADSCKAVRFSDVGWTDITSTTAAASVVLRGLGYEPSATVLSVPVTYTSLKNGDIDVFLGNWMPTMEADIAPYREDGSVETVGMNLTGAKYTLAVNKPAADGGIKSFADIAQHRDMLEGKIYGIEPGNDGNRLIQSMIDKNAFGLEGFEVVESSEQGMLAQVARANRKGEWIVFLGWEPHPMNANFRADLPRRRRRLVRPEFRRRGGVHQCPAGLRRRVPQCRQAARQPEVHAGHGKRDHDGDPRRGRGARQGGNGMAQGESRRAGRLAQRRDDH